MAFAKGKSGNPGGRPAGALNKATLAAQALLDGEAEALTRKAVEMALAGDLAALRMCLDRVLPVRKTTPLEIPIIDDSADAPILTAALLTAVARGELAVSDATAIAGLAHEHSKAINMRENANYQKSSPWADMFKW